MAIQFKLKNKKNTLPVNYGPSKRHIPKWRWILILLIVSAPLVFFMYLFVTRTLLQNNMGFVAYDTVKIRAPGNGYIESLNLKVSQPIKKNSILFKFKSPVLQSKKSQYIKELDTLKQRLTQQKNKEIISLKKLLIESKKDVEESKAHYNIFKNYLKQGTVNVIYMEDARKQLLSAQKKVNEVRALIAASERQFNHHIQNNFKSKISDLEREINNIAVEESYFTVYSAIDGSVYRIKTHEKEYVTAGQELLTLITNKNLHIIGYINPVNAKLINTGKIVSIVFADRKKIKGRIISRLTYADQNPLAINNVANAPKNKIIIIIDPIDKIPPRYRVHGVPVKINL